MIKNIIYDLGNVIIKYNQENIIKNFTENKDERNYILSEIFESKEWTQMDLGNITNQEAANIINKRNNYKYKDLTNNFLNNWYKVQTINRDIVNHAKELKAKGYNLFVISNMAIPTYEYFNNDEFFDLCSEVIISAKEHIKKPNEEIYKLLLERQNLLAEECIFIDDDDSGNNYKSANKVGIQGRKIIPNNLEDIKMMLSEFGV